MMDQGSVRNLEQIQERDGEGGSPRGVTLLLVALGGACIVFAGLAVKGTGGTFGYDLVGRDGKPGGKGAWAGVFSCKADGTDVRVECHSGINPVEVVTQDGNVHNQFAFADPTAAGS